MSKSSLSEVALAEAAGETMGSGAEAGVIGAGPVAPSGRLSKTGLWAARSLGPIIGALIIGAIILALLGRNPLVFYGDIFRTGLFSSNGWQGMLTRLAPLLLISIGYIVAFRAGIWNIGGDGQFLLAAAIIAGFLPGIMGSMSRPLGLIVLSIMGFVVGGVWTILPAYLKAWFGLNEIITSVMMSSIGINLANVLIKGPWRTTKSTVPQTDPVSLKQLLPNLGGTTIHIGIIVAVVAVVLVWYVLSRTSVGLRLTVLGANPRAALHSGLKVKRLIMTTFFMSGAFIGLAAAVEILGVWGYMRADWNPKFGLALFALVFLARLSPVATVPLAAFYAILEIGGRAAARNAELDFDFILFLIGMILLFMAVSEYFRLPKHQRKNLLTKAVDRLRLRRVP